MYNALSSVIGGGRGAHASAGTPRPARRGPSRRRVRTASAVLKNLVRPPEKDFFNSICQQRTHTCSSRRRGRQNAVRSTAHRPVVAGFQKRNRNPTVGAMLFCWRKPKAKPPFTCVNMIPE